MRPYVNDLHLYGRHSRNYRGGGSRLSNVSSAGLITPREGFEFGTHTSATNCLRIENEAEGSAEKFLAFLEGSHHQGCMPGMCGGAQKGKPIFDVFYQRKVRNEEKPIRKGRPSNRNPVSTEKQSTFSRAVPRGPSIPEFTVSLSVWFFFFRRKGVLWRFRDLESS